MAVTLQQIADHLGVSAQTVSCILRGQRESFRPETCQRVLEAAQAMGYQPNRLSRALLDGKSRTIGLIARALGGQTEVARLREAVLAARSHGYLTYLINIEQFGDNSDLVLDAARQLIERRVEGLLISHSTPISGEALAYLTSQQVPVVFLDWGPKDWPWHLHYDHVSGLQQMARHLAELGHRRVAQLVSTSNLDYAAYKVIPCQEAFAKVGIETLVNERWLIHSALNLGGEIAAYSATQRFLADHSDATALILGNDEMAIGALAAIQDAGLSVPNDLSVVGYNDVPSSRTCSPPLTTVRGPSGKIIGQRAVKVLHALMTAPGSAPGSSSRQASRKRVLDSQWVFPFDLVVRGSTGPASRQPRAPVPLEQLQAASRQRAIDPDHLLQPPSSTSPIPDGAASKQSRRRKLPVS